MQGKNTSLYNNNFEFIKTKDEQEKVCEDFFPTRYSMEMGYLSTNIDHREYDDTFCGATHDLAEVSMHRNGSRKLRVSQNERNLYRNLAKRLPRVRGLTFDSSQIRWISYWRNEQGKQVQKHFPVSKYGFNEARKLALSFIENQEAAENCLRKFSGQSPVRQSYYMACKQNADGSEVEDSGLLSKNPLSLFLLSQPLPTLSALNSATKPEFANQNEHKSSHLPSTESLTTYLDKITNNTTEEKHIPWTRASTISTCAFADNASPSIQSSYVRTPSLSGTLATPSPYNTRKNSINPDVEKPEKMYLKSGNENNVDQVNLPMENFEEALHASFLRARCSAVDKDYTEDARRLPKVKGVHFDSRQQRWCAYGGRKKECFSVYRYGFEKARELALESRRRTQSRCWTHNMLGGGMEKRYLTAVDLPDTQNLYHIFNHNKMFKEKNMIFAHPGWNALMDQTIKTERSPIKTNKELALSPKKEIFEGPFIEELKQASIRIPYNAETSSLVAVQYAEEAARMPKVSNVYWHKHKLCWYWRRKGAGYGSSKCFSARMYGFQKARALAIQYGKDQVSSKKLKCISGNIEDILSAMTTTADPSAVIGNL